MRNTTISLFALIFVLTVSSLAQAQESKPAEDKSATSAAEESEKPKNEVEKLIAEVNKRGEKVLASCIDPKKCAGESTSDQSPGVVHGRAVHLALPAYPPIARAAHAQGTVEVQVLIDEEGKVIAAASISGHPLLQATSVKAARESVFTPMKLDGTPVKVTGVLQYNFVAQ